MPNGIVVARAPRQREERRHLHPDVIDRILRKYAKRIGLDRGYSAHSMRATFINQWC
jgi:integrase